MSSIQVPVVEDIISLMRYIAQNNLTLRLTKSYREMALHQDVSILEVGRETVTMRATEAAICAALEGSVYLHHLLFPNPVAAHVTSLDLSRGIFILSGFKAVESEWRERQYERVRPKNPTYVNLHWRGRALRAPMDNVSVNGIGILAYKLYERGIELQPGVNVQLEFQLPPGYSFTSLKGTVVYLRAVGGSLVKTGIRLFPKLKEIRSLDKYVVQRKHEILQELERAYYELSKPHGVESLYF